MLQSDQVELKFAAAFALVWVAVASIGPGGIEIALHHLARLGPPELQSDQVELKYDKGELQRGNA